jgi:hypothetical protein
MPTRWPMTGTSVPYAICAETRLLVMRSRMKTVSAMSAKRIRPVVIAFA